MDYGIGTMSEFVRPDGYTPEKFPISQIFTELTDWVKEHKAPPVEALVHVNDVLSAHRPELHRTIDYGSTAITTAGHADIPGMEMGEIIKGNTRSARLVCVMLERKGDIQGKNLALSADVGKTGWDQLRFNAFWQLFIAITNLHDVVGNDQLAYTQFEKKLVEGLKRDNVNPEIIRGVNLPRETRLPEYIKHAQSYAKTIKSIGGAKPINRILQLIGTDVTIGGQAEAEMGRQFGVDIHHLTAVRPTTALDATASMPELQEDVRLLTQYGSKVAFHSGSTLTLEKNKVRIDRLAVVGE